jgi:mannitol-specific phosphotransferase system IIBC component
MNQGYFDNSTKAGTAGGTLLTIIANINSADLLKTVILAALGAVVSFGVTLLLKLLIKRLKK